MRNPSDTNPDDYNSANPRKHSAILLFVLPILEKERLKNSKREFVMSPERLSKLAGGYHTGSFPPESATLTLEFLVSIGTLHIVKKNPLTYKFADHYIFDLQE